jgi:V8-like Glu-specific endopeptidase
MILMILKPGFATFIERPTISWSNWRHLEYNINTFAGCSGATVFLLDKKQLSLVQPNDYGKAIAVHAGYKRALRSNIGLKIAGASANHLW